MLWNRQEDKYLQSVLEKSISYHTTARPKSTRKVSLSAMTRSFNDVVCVDHMFRDQYSVMNVMDAASRYSVRAVVDDTSMQQAILVLDGHWITPFWTPKTVVYDRAFKNITFMKYLHDQNIETRLLPPRRHSNNFLELKHRVIRDIFLRLKEAHDRDTED